MEDKVKEDRRKEHLKTLLSVIMQDTTIVPFRWAEGKYMCFYCPSLFVESEKLKEHTYTEHKMIDIDKTISKNLYRDNRIKLDVSELYCAVCEVKNTNFGQFLNHLRLKHDIKFGKEAAEHFDCFVLDDNNMNCLECGENFRFFGPLLVHTYKYHVEQHLCDVCGQGFVGKHNMENHKRHAHTVKACKHCHETFPTLYALKNHVANTHRTDTLKCPICPEILANLYLKKRHMALVHNCKSVQIVCEFCDKVFTRNSRYVEHKLRVHFKEKNFTCDVCGYKTFNKSSMKEHFAKHVDIRSFKCELCSKKFKLRKALVAHVKSHVNDK